MYFSCVFGLKMHPAPFPNPRPILCSSSQSVLLSIPVHVASLFDSVSENVLCGSVAPQWAQGSTDLYCCMHHCVPPLRTTLGVKVQQSHTHRESSGSATATLITCPGDLQPGRDRLNHFTPSPLGDLVPPWPWSCVLRLQCEVKASRTRANEMPLEDVGNRRTLSMACTPAGQPSSCKRWQWKEGSEPLHVTTRTSRFFPWSLSD